MGKSVERGSCSFNDGLGEKSGLEDTKIGILMLKDAGLLLNMQKPLLEDAGITARSCKNHC
jgi:hypothetical protein